MSTDLKQISRVLGQIPSGCFVMTAHHAGQSTGLLVSWVQQAGFEPPAVTVAVKASRPILTLIEASRHFVLNLVPEDRTPMFKHFGRGFKLEEPAFEGLATREEPAGIVIESCAGHLDCRVVAQMELADHRIYVAEIAGGRMHGDARPYVHLRANGLNY